MPKHTVNNPNPLAVGEKRFRLVVGWNRDMDVQVGIETDDQPDGQHHLVDHVYGGEAATIGAALRARLGLDELYDREGSQLDYDNADLGRMVLDAVTGSTPFGTSVWTHPDRQGINRMIRLLREARDQAYGKDA